MVNTIIADCDVDLAAEPAARRSTTCSPATSGRWPGRSPRSRPARLDADAARRARAARPRGRTVPVLGITGTGGSGKSSLTDELVRRFRLDQEDKLRIAVLAVDPTRRRGGGALLGDRIRMNAIDRRSVFFRSLATRGAGSEVPDAARRRRRRLPRPPGYDLVIVETPGIGQGDAGDRRRTSTCRST